MIWYGIKKNLMNNVAFITKLEWCLLNSPIEKVLSILGFQRQRMKFQISLKTYALFLVYEACINTIEYKIMKSYENLLSDELEKKLRMKMFYLRNLKYLKQ